MRALPEIVQQQMDRFAALTGRQYHLFDYHGAADADRVIVMMGSGTETARATAAALNEQGERVGVLQVRLYRPFAAEAFLARAATQRARHRGAGADQGTRAHQASRSTSTSSTRWHRRSRAHGGAACRW